jgi:hypothetical protein
VLTKSHDPLKNVRVATPCQTSWETMTGDERVRYCSLCSLNVYNFAEMTWDEVRELLLRSEGRVCGRLYRRADGTIITRDCPTGLRALRRRMSRMATATIAALFSFASLAFGGTTCEKPETRKRGNVQIDIEQAARQQKAVFTGVVLLGGNPLPGATVTVSSESEPARFMARADANGTFTIESLDDGLYRVDVTLAAALEPAVIEHLQLNANEVTKARFAVQLEAVRAVTVGIISAEPIPNGMSTTFTQEFINKLPI